MLILSVVSVDQFRPRQRPDQRPAGRAGIPRRPRAIRARLEGFHRVPGFGRAGDAYRHLPRPGTRVQQRDDLRLAHLRQPDRPHDGRGASQPELGARRRADHRSPDTGAALRRRRARRVLRLRARRPAADRLLRHRAARGLRIRSSPTTPTAAGRSRPSPWAKRPPSRRTCSRSGSTSPSSRRPARRGRASPPRARPTCTRSRTCAT